MKRIILTAVFLAAVLFCLTACAESGEWNGLTWNLDGEGLLTVTGEGSLDGFGYFGGSDAWHADSETENSIRRVTVGHGVTRIGSYAFTNCHNITEVTLSDTVEEVSGYAFYYSADSMTSIRVEGENPSLKDLDGVLFSRDGSVLIIYPRGRAASSYRVPDGVAGIEGRAFYEARDLTAVTLPAGLKSIGENAFCGCSGLSAVNLPDSLEEIYNGAFADCGALTGISLPGSLTVIRESVFQNTGLTGIVIPSGVETIEQSAFRWNQALVSVSIPESVTSIGEYAFFDCGLPSAVLHDHISGIGGSAFSQSTVIYARFGSETANALSRAGLSFRDPEANYSLKYQYDENGNMTAVILTDVDETAAVLNVPAFVTEIWEWSLIQSRTLKEINVDPANEYYSSQDGVLFSKDGSTLICYPSGRTAASCTVPGGVKTIGPDAFAHSAHLTEVTLPEGITEVCSCAFSDCASLVRISLPASLTVMGEDSADECFEECKALAEIRVAEGNPRYAAFDGILYNRDLTVMELVPRALAGDVVIPDGVEEISGYFGPGLTGITIPASVTRICGYAFYGCSNLNRIVIPEGTGQKTWMFCYYGELGQVTLPATVTEVGELAFNGSGVFRELQPDFILPSGLKAIGEEAFKGIKASYIYIPDYVTVGKRAFAECPNLRCIYLCTSAEQLAGDAFDGCSNLTVILGHPIYNEDGGITDYCDRHGFDLITDEFEWGEG